MALPRVSTKLTRLLGIKAPIVCGNMAGASGGALASQVSLAGGFGFLAWGYEKPEKLRAEVATARAAFNVDAQSPLPIGIGFLGWQLEKPDAPASEVLSIALENNVQAVWLSFGVKLKQWIQFIRDNEKKPGFTKIFVQVSTVEEALVAVNDWKVDAVVAQGIEAGGHGLGTGQPVLTLLSSILEAVPKDGPPIIAAGGFVHGGHLAALLTLGASGAVFGTRFLLASESLYSNSQRQALIAAKSSTSVRTMAFDEARGTLGWPAGIDGRGLRNSTVEDFEKGIDVGTLRSRYAEGQKADDVDRIVVWSGLGVGLMNKVQPAKEIVAEIQKECVERLQNAASLVLH